MATSAVHAEPFAYVANLGSASVSVIDTDTNSVTATIPVGAAPTGVAIAPNGSRAYVTNQNAGSVSVIDIATNTVIATVAVGAAPRGIAITPNGAFVYVTNANSNSVSAIATATNTVAAAIPVGLTPLGVAISPDGAFAFVANANSDNVSVIATATNAIAATVGVGADPEGVAFTPDGAFAYVANQNSANVSVIDTATNAVSATITVGSTPVGVAISGDGAFAYIANGGSNNVSVIDTATNAVMATVSVGVSPFGVAITPGGDYAYVSNFNSNNVTVIDIATNTVSATVSVGAAPFGLAITPVIETRYRMTNLGTLGGPNTNGYDLNESGQVTGTSMTSNGFEHAFLWTGTEMVDLGTLGGTTSIGIAINSAGTVTGYAGTSEGRLHAFISTGALMEDLGTFGGSNSYANAINDSGWVTGRAEHTDGNEKAFLWNGIELLNVGLGDSSAEGLAINESGWVVGRTNGESRAFLWDGISTRDLGDLGGDSAEAFDINDSGWVAGLADKDEEVTPFIWNGVSQINIHGLPGEDYVAAMNASGWVVGETETASGQRAWVWNGSVVPIGTLSGREETEPRDINDQGYVTGNSDTASHGDSRAFLWDGNRIRDLNDLIDPADPLLQLVTLRGGMRINNQGQILAQGTIDATGEYRAFLLTPGAAGADTTPPTIQVDVTGTLGDAGWYVSDVQVSWTISDPESDISTSTGCDLTHVAGDTAGVTLTCTATSTGGTTSEDVTIKRDETSPVANAAALPMPNGNGWNNSDVTVSFTGNDATSGIAGCSENVLVTSEGSNQQSPSGQCTDNAGNSSAHVSGVGINIDKTAPIVTAGATPPPNGAGWNSTAVVVAFAGVDALSGVTLDGCDPPFVISSNGMGQGVSGRCFDRAGNAASMSYTGLNIDTTPPVAEASRTPAANANGWNNTNVTASWAGTDALSGSGVSSCSPNFVFSAEGANQSTNGSCLDIAGLVSSLAEITGVSIDKTVPAVPSIFVPVPNDGFVIGETPISNYSCADSLSGIANCTGTVASGAAIDASSLGAHSFRVIATDRAGNERNSGDNYNVNLLNTAIITTVAGNSSSGFGGDGGPATSASLDGWGGVAVDAAGNFYIGDQSHHRVRKVSPDGVISTVAGNGIAGFSGDFGVATAASLNFPAGVAVDSAGNLYIADVNNHRIRRVGVNGIISTVAGNGLAGFSGDGGSGPAASLSSAEFIAVSAAGEIYIADTTNQRVRKVNTNGIIYTVAGSGQLGFSGDGGPAILASMHDPFGVSVDGAGNLYIADSFNRRIRKVTPAGVISTVAGNGTAGFSGDGAGATAASLANPIGVAADTAGSFYIADYFNSRIRRVTPDGVISTVAGNGTTGFSGDGGAATSASIGFPRGVATDIAGKIYIADTFSNRRIRRVRETTYTLAPMAVFGSQTLNVSSVPRAITLTNRGPQPVSATSITITGANPGQFSQTNNCGIQTFQAIETTCTINVVFRPTSNGAKSGVLNVNTAGGTGTRSVSLSGTGGPTYVLEPYSLAFGRWPAGLPRDVLNDKNVLLRNTGTLTLPISSITINGANGNQFQFSTNCGSSLPAGVGCSIVVWFQPTTVGAKTANLNVNAGGGAGSKSVSLTGNSTPPTYSLSANSLAFNNQAVSVPNATGTVILTNTGLIPVPITSVTDNGTNANQFTETHNCGSSVAVGGSCTISVTFLPTSAGAKVATMNVNAGGGAGTQTVALTGTGVVPAFSRDPISIAFLPERRGTSSKPQEVTVVNTGSVQLTIVSVTRTGATSGQFGHTSMCTAPVPVGGSCSISVMFSPTSAGNKSAILNINAGGGAGTKTVALTGTGTK